jgi:hypothetical protein
MGDKGYTCDKELQRPCLSSCDGVDQVVARGFAKRARSEN